MTEPAILEAGALPRAALDGRALLQYRDLLRDHIGHFQRYPGAARLAGDHGVVSLCFTLQDDGALIDVWIEHGSGSALLDAEAVATVRRAAPLPAFPAGLPDELTISLPIQFDLDRPA